MKRRLSLSILFPVVCFAVIFLAWNGIPGGAPKDVGNEASELAAKAPALPGAAARVALSLALIILLILAAAWAYRLVAGKETGTRACRVRILDRCFLAPKRALYIVRLGGRVVVIGVTESSITPVLELSSEESGKLYPEPRAEGGEERATFGGVLRSVTAKMSGTRN